MAPEEVGALLDAAALGWIRFATQRPIYANEHARSLREPDALPGDLPAWHPALGSAAIAAIEASLAALPLGGPPASLRVTIDLPGSPAPTVLRLILARPAATLVDLLIADINAVEQTARDLAEAEELIALLPPHLFWEVADVSKQQTIQARLEAMVAERTASLELEIRERKEAERAAIAANQAKSAFLTNISHELRTPLNAVLGYTELILEELPEDHELAATRDDLGRIATAGRYLLQLVTELLDLSKIESGETDLSPAPLDLRRWLGELVRGYTPAAAARGNRCDLRIDPAVREISVDILKLRQIVDNLVSNAHKFTQGGSITVTAQLLPADTLELVVADTGIGIAEERLASLFDPFVQASVTTTRGSSSPGLGLALSRRYAELMGGSLTATSAVGIGTTLRLRLPLRSPRPDPPSRP